MYVGVEAGLGSNKHCKEQDSFGKAIVKGAAILGTGAALAYGGRGAYRLAKKAYGDDVASQAFKKGKQVVKDTATDVYSKAKRKYNSVSPGDAVGGSNVVNP